MKSTLAFVALLLWSAYALRVRFVTDYMLNDDPSRACYSDAVQYTRGNPTGTVTCEDTSATKYENIPQNDCIGKCTTYDIITPQIAYFLMNDTLPWLKNRLQELFYVPPAYQSNPWLVPSSVTQCSFKTNSGISIPAQWSTTGFNDTDLVIIVTMRPMVYPVFAQGLYCARDATNQRPILGLLNIPPVLAGQSTKILRSMVLQQAIHILGFHYPILRTLYGINTVQSTINGATRTTNYLNFTKSSIALKNYQQHTGCSNTVGIELEDNLLPLKPHLWSIYTDPSSYLEKRVFFNELMTSEFSTNPFDGPVLSTITLGIMEDMKWYKANYSASDLNYIFGKNTGCTLQDQQCQRWTPPDADSKNRMRWYFCREPKADSYCTIDHTSKGNCDVSKYTTSIPKIYQHFSDETSGGPSRMNDYCPSVIRIPSGDCRNVLDTPYDSTTAEIYGNTSRCFLSSLTEQISGKTRSSALSTCFPTACGPAKNGTSEIYLYVKIGKYWSQCPREGGDVISVSLYSGSLFCPPYDVICSENVTTANFNWDIADPEKNKAQPNWSEQLAAQIAALPWWVWLIIGLGLGSIILLLIVLIIGCAIRQSAINKRKKNAVNVVDLRNPDKKESRYDNTVKNDDDSD